MKFSVFFLFSFFIMSGYFFVDFSQAETSEATVTSQQIIGKLLGSSGISGNKGLALLSPEEQGWLAEHGPRVRVSLVNLPPLQFKQDGEFTGYQVDILEAVLKRVGLQPVYTMDPFVNVYADLKEKKTEISLDFIPTEERRQVVLFSEKKFDIYMGIFARKERTDLNSIEALKNAVIASHPGYGLEPKLKRLLPDAEIVHAVDPQGMFRLVSSGKADVVIHGLASGEFMLQKNLINNVVSHGEFLAKGESRLQAAEFIVRKDLPHLMSIINKTYASISEAEKQSIWNKWFGINASKVKTSSILFTDKELAWLAQNHTVEVRVINIPPYIILKNGAAPEGISIDYLKLISERTGVKFKYNFSGETFSEALDGIEKHLGPDLISSMMRTQEREQSLLFSRDYFKAPYVIFTHKDDKKIIADVTDLLGKKIALPKRTVIHQKVNTEYPDLNLVLFDNDIQAIEAVATEKADAYIGNLTLASYLILDKGLSNLKIAGPSPFGDHVFSMGIRNDWPELVSIIDKALATISPEDQSKIRNKYISIRYEHVDTGVITKWILIFGGAALGIVFLFVLWNRTLARKVRERTADLQYHATLLENVSDAVLSVDTDFKVISWNKACENIYGWKAEEVMGKIFEDLTSIAYQDCTREDAFEQITKNQNWRGEVIQTCKDGEKIYVQASISLVKNNRGETSGYVGVNRDITEQKKNEEELRKTEEYFSKVFYSQAIPMAILNTKTGERIDFNESYVDLTGYSREELQQDTLFSLTVGVDPKEQLQAVETLRKERKVSGYPITMKTKSGETKHLIGSAAMLEYGDGNLAISAWADITKRIRAEEQLRVSEEKFFKVFQGSPNAVSISNLESGKFVEVNTSFERLFDYSHHEIIDKSYLDVDIWKNPSDRDRLMKDYLKTGLLHVEGLELVTKTGETKITDVNFVIMEMSGIDHSIAIITDITKRKQTEERVQQYQERLKALASQLTIAEEKERGRIAVELHDHVGQTLAFTRVQLARAKTYATEGNQTDILNDISDSLLETIRETRDLMFDLSSPVLYEIGLSEATANWLEERIGKKHGVKFELIDNSSGLVLEDDLKSILFRNIREIATNTVRHAQASLIVVSIDHNDTELTIIVRDNGIGFSPDEVIGRVDPGGGFGLFSIKERMEDFGGTLSITSAPGKGCKAVLSVSTRA